MVVAAIFGTVAILAGRGVRWGSTAGFGGNGREGSIIYVSIYTVSISPVHLAYRSYIRSVDRRASRAGRLEGIVAECATSVRPSCHSRLSRASMRR